MAQLKLSVLGVATLLMLKAPFTTSTNTTTTSQPPPADQAAAMARYIVHVADWTTVSFISRQKTTFGYPMGRVFSMADGPQGQSSGTPYLYIPLIEEDSQNLVKDHKCSMTMSLAQGSHCMANNYDPEDPRCAQVILTGRFNLLTERSKEWLFAKNALFSRHPSMQHWPAEHQFRIGKLVIREITLVDDFGPNKYPSVHDYYNVTQFQGNAIN